jgi:membrane-bound ClpP family serine protease
MRWESSSRTQSILAFTKQGINYKHLIILTFGVPSILCLIIALTIFIFSVLSFHGVSVNLVQGIINFFSTSNYVNATEKMMIPVSLSIIIDSAFFCIFWVKISNIIKLTKSENKKCEENLPWLFKDI